MPQPQFEPVSSALSMPEDGSNPYIYNGHDSTPARFRRVMSTPEKMVRTLGNCMRWHGLVEADIVGRTGLDHAIVRTVIQEGRGSLDDVIAVLEAADIVPLVVPDPRSLKEGVVSDD